MDWLSHSDSDAESDDEEIQDSGLLVENDEAESKESLDRPSAPHEAMSIIESLNATSNQGNEEQEPDACLCCADRTAAA